MDNSKTNGKKYTYRLQQVTAVAGFSSQPIIVRVIVFCFSIPHVPQKEIRQ
jgi:hypothetical protein